MLLNDSRGGIDLEMINFNSHNYWELAFLFIAVVMVTILLSFIRNMHRNDNKKYEKMYICDSDGYRSIQAHQSNWLFDLIRSSVGFTGMSRRNDTTTLKHAHSLEWLTLSPSHLTSRTSPWGSFNSTDGEQNSVEFREKMKMDIKKKIEDKYPHQSDDINVLGPYVQSFRDASDGNCLTQPSNSNFSIFLRSNENSWFASDWVSLNSGDVGNESLYDIQGTAILANVRDMGVPLSQTYQHEDKGEPVNMEDENANNGPKTITEYCTNIFNTFCNTDIEVDASAKDNLVPDVSVTARSGHLLNSSVNAASCLMTSSAQCNAASTPLESNVSAQSELQTNSGDGSSHKKRKHRKQRKQHCVLTGSATNVSDNTSIEKNNRKARKKKKKRKKDGKETDGKDTKSNKTRELITI